MTHDEARFDESAVVEKTRVAAPTVIGPEGTEIPAKGLVLGIEKFAWPNKRYRLIWMRRGEAWLASEDETDFRKRETAVAAGERLAAEKGVKFSVVTR